MFRKFFITNSLQLKPNKIAEFYKKNYCDNNRIFVKFINKILWRWRELQKFQNSTFDFFTKQKFHRGSENYYGNYLEDFKKLQNEVNCMNDSKDFRDAESICSGNSTRYLSTWIIP